MVIAFSMITIPRLDSTDSVTMFFLATWGGVLVGSTLFFVLLIREIDYYAYRLGQALVFVLLFVAMLGCFYLYFNVRMGTGICSQT